MSTIQTSQTSQTTQTTQTIQTIQTVPTPPIISVLMSARLKELYANPDMAKIYAKRGCRKCNGIGIITWEKPNAIQLCPCVIKYLKKEVAKIKS